MEGVNQVNCDICGNTTDHIKREELQTNNSSTVVLCCNRDHHEGDIYKNLNIPEFLRLERNGINNTHQMVGATIHKPGHFIALRKFNGNWYVCDDNRIKKLSQNEVMFFHDKTYSCNQNGFPNVLVSTHGTMVVYDKIN